MNNQIQNKDYPLKRIEISKKRILQNTRLLMNTNKVIKIAPVLKSNAYGHGIEEVGNILSSLDFPFYCVNSLYDAQLLRNAGVKTDILIMGYVAEEDLQKKQWDFSFALFDLEQAYMINKYQKKTRVHLNVETGLHREGVDVVRFNNLVQEIKKLKNIQVEGLMSHYACSNDPSCPTTAQQIIQFKKAKNKVLKAGFAPKWFHFGGSLALLNKIAHECNVIRCGKALFGIALNSSYTGEKKENTDKTMQQFKPTLALKTKIAQLKKVHSGEHVGYADAFVAEKDMTIAILPIGYFDGVDRRLSNKGFMSVEGVPCKIIGMVAMNVTVIDVTEVQNPFIGQDVIVYSQEPNDINSLDNSAKQCSTLPQELLVHLATSLKRVVVDKGSAE